MLKIIETVFSLISLVILTSVWIFTASAISFYFKKASGVRIARYHRAAYSILLGLLLEIVLSLISLAFTNTFNSYDKALDLGILSGLEKGRYIAVLLSPISSITGAAIGAQIKYPPWRHH